MIIAKYWSAFCLAFILGNIHPCLADTGIDGTAITSSSFTMTGPVFMSSVTVTSATIANLSVTSALNYAGTLGKVMQIVSNTSTINFSTTSSNFQTTNLSASITPTSASNKILIIAASQLEVDGAVKLGGATIARGGSNILASHGQFFVQTVAGASSQNFPVTLVYLDSPSSTSSLTYAAQILSNDGSTTVQFPGTNAVTQFILLVELRP